MLDFNFKYMIMKNFLIKSVIGLTLISFLVSCEEDINITQGGLVLDEIVVTQQSEMQPYLNGIYAQVNNDNQVGFTTIFTDESGVGVGTGGQNFDTHRFQISQSNGFATGIWYSNYSVINKVNRFLKYAEKITPTDQLVFKNLIAQAKVLRAFAYCELLYYFAPNMKDDNSLGVMLYTFVPPDFKFELPRSTVGEVSKQIESDLDTAFNDLTSTSQFLARKATVNAIKARYYLFRGKYDLAEQFASAASAGLTLTLAGPVPNGLVDADLGIIQNNPNTVIDDVGTQITNHKRVNGYVFGNTINIVPTSPYRLMFTDVNQGEIIFALNRPGPGNWPNIYSTFSFNTSSANGGLMFEVGRNLFNDLVSIPNDIRKFNALDASSRVEPNIGNIPFPSLRQRDVLVIDKYPGKPSAQSRNNSKIFRLSEMRLIIAECKARRGDLAGATNEVEAIRTARKYTTGAVTIPDYTTLGQALTEILFERKIELCFEGHRFLDLKRLGTEVNKTIERNIVDDVLPSLPLSIPVGDFRYTLPIPQAEVNANPTIQQNPGY